MNLRATWESAVCRTFGRARWRVHFAAVELVAINGTQNTQSRMGKYARSVEAFLAKLTQGTRPVRLRAIFVVTQFQKTPALEGSRVQKSTLLC